MEDRVCRDKMYPTKHIECFPLEVTLKSLDNNIDKSSNEEENGIRLVLNYALQSDLPDCQRLVEEAAARGDNVGVDEFRNNKDFDDLFERSEIFIGRGSGDTKVFVLISPCTEVRSYFDSCMTTLRIIYTSDLDQNQRCVNNNNETQLPVCESYYQQLLRLAVHWIRAIDLGYTQCSVRMAVCCPLYVEALKREGFEIQVTVPYSVNICGRGLTTDYWFTKTMDEPTKHVRVICI